MKLRIRPENVQDVLPVSRLIKKAFNNNNQVILAELLRRKNDKNKNLSIVAEINGIIAGHILLSKIQIATENSVIDTLWLEPLSIHPYFQNLGIGKRLIQKGLNVARHSGFKSVFVVGHIEYYSRFGFIRANHFGITSSIKIPDEAFLAIELDQDSLKNSTGQIIYPPELYE